MTKKILLVSGKACSGKDTVSDILIEKYGRDKWEKFRFADSLKDEVSSIYNIKKEHFYTQEGKKMINRYGLSNRDLLINHGSKRRDQNPDYWVDKLKEKIRNTDKNVIVSDFRFPNEFHGLYCSKYPDNLKTMRITRKNSLNIDSPSEKMLDDFIFDYYIDNNIIGNDNVLKQLDKIEWLN